MKKRSKVKIIKEQDPSAIRLHKYRQRWKKRPTSH